MAILKEHGLHHFKSYERAYNEAFQKKIEAALEKYSKLWDKFIIEVADFRRCFSERRGTVHFGTAANRLAVAIADLCFKHFPPRPEQGKWTKTAPANDFILNLSSPIQHFLPGLVDLAYGHIKIDGTDEDADMKLLDLHQASGVRVLVAKKLAGDPMQPELTCIFSLLSTSTRCIQTFFLRMSRAYHSPDATPESFNLSHP